MLNRLYKEESGVLTFEWILLVTLLVIGIVGAVSAVRDAINTELGDVAEAMVALDQSYYICWPWEVGTPDNVADGASNSYFRDGAYIYQARTYQGNIDETCEGEGAKPSQLDDDNTTAFNDQAENDGTNARNFEYTTK